MADFTAIAAAGQSLERLLSAAFADPMVAAPAPGHVTRALLVTNDALDVALLQRPCLTLMLHHVRIERFARNAAPRPGDATTDAPGARTIALALHYLLTPWAADAESEQRILGRTLQVLERAPVLTGPQLLPPNAWAADDALEVIYEELASTELRDIFTAASAPYRTSLAYIVRMPRFDLHPTAPHEVPRVPVRS